MQDLTPTCRHVQILLHMLSCCLACFNMRAPKIILTFRAECVKVIKVSIFELGQLCWLSGVCKEVVGYERDNYAGMH